MYLTYNKEISVTAKRLIRTLKNRIYKYMTDIIHKYNNTYQRTIKMKSIDVESNFHAEYNVNSNEKKSKV